MFIFAHLLFFDIAFTAGVLSALVARSRSGNDEMSGVRSAMRYPYIAYFLSTHPGKHRKPTQAR